MKKKKKKKANINFVIVKGESERGHESEDIYSYMLRRMRTGVNAK